jgi:hypothetical protein
MAYSGTTAVATAQNIPVKVTWGGIAAGGFSTGITTGSSGAGYFNPNSGPATKQANNVWLYNTTDLTTQMSTGFTYFTDGFNLGMRPGDLLIGTCGLSSAAGTPYVKTITYVSTAGVGISTGSVI